MRPTRASAKSDPLNPNQRLFAMNETPLHEIATSNSETVNRTSSGIVSTTEPLVDRKEDHFLIVDAARDRITSGFRGAVCTVDADMYLTEGISLSGTHYGLNLISVEGVVLVGKDARILPSRKRASRIAAQKVVIAGEAILESLQGDQLVALADHSKTVVSKLLRGEASLITDKADWILTGQARKLTKNEPRVAQLYEQAMNEGSLQANGFDEIRAAQELAIDNPRSTQHASE